MKLEKLTTEQEALIAVVRDEWLDRAFKLRRFDETEARTAIEWIYKEAKLERPSCIFVDSPLGAQFAAHFIKSVSGTAPDQVRAQVGAQVRAQVGAQVGDQVRAQVGDQVRAQVWAQVRAQVRAQVWDQVGAQVWAQVGDQVRDQVGAQVWDQKLEWNKFAYMGWWNWSWCAFYDYFQRIGVKIPEDTRLNEYLKFLRSGVYDFIALKGLAIVCRPPSLVSRDQNNRLSSLTGPCIEWADGFKLWAINGVWFDAELFEKVTQNKLTAKEILALENMEQRMAALKIRGAEKLLIELESKLIHKSDRGNELHLIEDVFSQPAYFAKYSCPSTGRVYVSGIDPEVGSKRNADLAMAWKHNLTLEQYQRIQPHHES